eukprot:CAMPEP_0184751716 /NCGR_PEP_ID=MMETSP0315-20130426/43195_1 /TAXON_ID=101924 /ORGANISM="Rhodosorus marinus, Strain UTEX LB 2760" /LENGTH=132 /DNA_ID=CAMNT_0027230999 /DNA_START=1152 /DNA_END=1550 /DNA_ORIENTATION=-
MTQSFSPTKHTLSSDEEQSCQYADHDKSVDDPEEDTAAALVESDEADDGRNHHRCANHNSSDRAVEHQPYEVIAGRKIQIRDQALTLHLQVDAVPQQSSTKAKHKNTDRAMEKFEARLDLGALLLLNALGVR